MCRSSFYLQVFDAALLKDRLSDCLEVDEVEFVDSKSESQGQQQVQQEQAQPMTPPPAMQTAMPEGPVPELELDGDAQLPFDVMGY